jgi:hypothetical protein
MMICCLIIVDYSSAFSQSNHAPHSQTFTPTESGYYTHSTSEQGLPQSPRRPLGLHSH